MSIGTSLREAREQSGLTLDQVSQVTRIRRAMLEALENDDWSACGGDVYARGHIKSYARAVGIDGAALLAGGGSRPEPSPDPATPSRAPHQTTQVVSTPEPVPIRSMGQALASEKKAATAVTRTGPNWSAVMAGALAVVVVLGVLGYVARGRGDTPAPSAATSTSPAATPTTAAPTPSATPKPTPTIVAVRPTTDVVTVVIKATGSSWVQANTGKGGSVLWEGTADRGRHQDRDQPEEGAPRHRQRRQRDAGGERDVGRGARPQGRGRQGGVRPRRPTLASG